MDFLVTGVLETFHNGPEKNTLDLEWQLRGKPTNQLFQKDTDIGESSAKIEQIKGLKDPIY